MTCRGICKRYKALRPANGSGRRYSAGQKRCAMCETFIIWNEVWCPCCGSTLRTKPKNTVDRRRAARDLSIAYNNMPQLGERFITIEPPKDRTCTTQLHENRISVGIPVMQHHRELNVLASNGICIAWRNSFHA